MVLAKDYSKLPSQDVFKVDALRVPPYVGIGPDIRAVIRTNDIGLNWTTGEPGDVIDWHSHSPDMYQIRAIIEGACTWRYRDNDGEERSITGEAGEVVFIPPGMENRVEVTGDGPYHQIGITRRSRCGNLEKLTGEAAGGPTSQPRGVVYDDMNARFISKHDEAFIG